MNVIREDSDRSFLISEVQVQEAALAEKDRLTALKMGNQSALDERGAEQNMVEGSTVIKDVMVRKSVMNHRRRAVGCSTKTPPRQVCVCSVRRMHSRGGSWSC